MRKSVYGNLELRYLVDCPDDQAKYFGTVYKSKEVV